MTQQKETKSAQSATDLYSRAFGAANALYGLPYAHVQLGVGMDPAVVHELAKLLGCPLSAFVTTSLGRPVVIESLAGATLRGVRIEAQGTRPATAEDAHLPGFVDQGRHLATAESLIGGGTP